MTSIEHFYGIGDAALDGIQNFPPDMNYSNEFHRFARAGELYAQANPEKLRAVVELMASKGVAWSPTLSIYEASRDAIRAQNLPWYRDYLHPSMELYWKPNLDNHGSYFVGWGNTQEVRWRQNYRIWMDALRALRREGRPDHDRRRRRATSTRSTASAWCASSSCTRRPASIPSK